ncbi:MFS transporter [Hamadaea sp. NPDC051192]|uniref:MFS transporter n=1 Tax=Hamadaea sp. NPDC051192 TaxID=3154940 RepID=UPI003439C764
MSVWRVRDFRVFFTATSFSQLGVNAGYVAAPTLAVTALDATTAQVGLLATLSTVAFLLIGLPSGAWVDRLNARRVLVAADLIRAVLIGSVPVAWWLGGLTLAQLYAVVLINGCATVFFDVGSQSVLPRLVGRENLIPANAAVVTLISGATVAGRGAGGALVQLLTAPIALAYAAAAHLASAIRLATFHIRPSAEPSTSGGSLRSQVAEGLRHVLGDRTLRALAATAALSNLGSQLINTVLPIVVVRDLGLPAGALGGFWAVGGVGLLIGARLARPIAARLGDGPTLAYAGLILAPAALAVPLLDRGPAGGWSVVGWLLAMGKIGLDNVLGVSIRQRRTPDRLLGRMNATFRFLLTGALAIGAALAGLVGQLAGVRATMWAGGVLLAIAFVPVFVSPLRRATADGDTRLSFARGQSDGSVECLGGPAGATGLRSELAARGVVAGASVRRARTHDQ